MTDQNQIMMFLPIMKELEMMGHNPVEVMFGPRPTMDVIEDCYVAQHRAAEKYPEWHEVVAEWIDKRMLRI